MDRLQFDASAEQPGRPMIFRTPGYPAFIATVQSLFGRSIVPVLAAQGILGGLVAPMVVDLSRRLGAGSRVAGSAGAASALDPLSIVASGFLLTETLAQVTTVAAVWLLVRLVQEHAWRVSISAGAALAATLLIRPSLYYLVPILVVLVAWALRAAEHRGVLVAAMMLPMVLTTGAWQMRNQAVADFGSFSAVEHVNLGLWRGVGVLRRERGGEIRTLQVDAALEAARLAGSGSSDPDLLLRGQAPADVDQAAYYGDLRAMGLDQLRARPDLALLDLLNGATVVAIDVDETRLGLSPFTTGRILEQTLQGALIVLYGFAAVGFVLLLRQHRRGLLIVGFTVAYVFGTSSGPDAVGRYRLPVLPLLVPLAVAGLAGMRDWDRRRQGERSR